MNKKVQLRFDKKQLIIIYLVLIFVSNFSLPNGGNLYSRFTFCQSYSDGVYFRSLIGSIYKLLINKYDYWSVFLAYEFIIILFLIYIYIYILKITHTFYCILY